jgi:sarcosine oxidase subunit beta
MTEADPMHRQPIVDMEIAIIGGGVIGCSIALELARRGARPTVIERNGEVGHGSTAASCGIIRRFYSTPTMTAMADEGARIWADWGGYLGAAADEDLARFERPGMLFLPQQIDANIENILGHMRDQGIEAELLSAEEIGRRFPFLDTRSHSPIRAPDDDEFFAETGRSIAGGVFEHGAGYVVSPSVATSNLRAACEREGVTFWLGHRVRGIAADPLCGFILDCASDAGPRELRTSLLVNAAGPHSTVVNKMAGVELPIEIRALRREVHAVENPTFVEGAGSRLPVVGDLDSGIYLRPESGGHDLVVGSLDPDCDVMEWVDEPDEVQLDCTAKGYDRQVMRMMKRLPEAQIGKRRGVVGLYDVTPLDWNPVLDKTDRPGYFVAIGTSGSSFKTAPVIGQIMADLIGACVGGRDHDRDPVHSTLGRTGFDVDVSFFSRLRAGHHSSGTVLS